jgi:hypothetical protein
MPIPLQANIAPLGLKGKRCSDEDLLSNSNQIEVNFNTTH